MMDTEFTRKKWIKYSVAAMSQSFSLKGKHSSFICFSIFFYLSLEVGEGYTFNITVCNLAGCVSTTKEHDTANWNCGPEDHFKVYLNKNNLYI